MFWTSDTNAYQRRVIYVRAPGFLNSDGEEIASVYYPTSISADGKTAILDCSSRPFPADQQGPFFAYTYASTSGTHINADNTSLHVGNTHDWYGATPMVARADNYGELCFKHLFGVLKIYVNMPQGYTPVSYYSFRIECGFGNDLSQMASCDVNWDANGEITMSNIVKLSHSNSVDCRFGNGYYFCMACPGDWENLQFEGLAVGPDDYAHWFRKTMAEGASIHIERAGITTITINYTEDDMVR